MSLLSIPSVTKGESAIVTLNKSELFSLSAVSSDPTFSIQANVKKCIVEYGSNPGIKKRFFNLTCPNRVRPPHSFFL